MNQMTFFSKLLMKHSSFDKSLKLAFRLDFYVIYLHMKIQKILAFGLCTARLHRKSISKQIGSWRDLRSSYLRAFPITRMGRFQHSRVGQARFGRGGIYKSGIRLNLYLQYCKSDIAYRQPKVLVCIQLYLSRCINSVHIGCNPLT